MQELLRGTLPTPAWLTSLGCYGISHSSWESHRLLSTEREKKKNFAASYLSCLQSGNSFHLTKKVLWNVDRASFLSTLSRGKNLKSCYKKLALANWPCALTLFINTFRITKSDFMQEIHILICLVSHYCLWPLGLIKWCLLDLIALLQFISRKSFSSWPHPETRKEHEVPTLLVP